MPYLGEQKFMKWIGQLWRGEIALSRAFWKFGVLVPVILVIAFGVLSWAVLIFMSFFLFAGPSAPGWLGGAPFVILAMMVLVLAYQVIACVGVWRSAGKYSGKPIYSALARGVLALFLAVVVTDVVATIMNAFKGP
jgi:hypothetical protein